MYIYKRKCNYHFKFDAFCLQFQSFDLQDEYEEHCYDYVIVAPRESLLNNTEPFCGKYTAAELRNLSFVSDGNYAVIKFVSDDRIAGSGYSAVFYSSPPGMYHSANCLRYETGVIDKSHKTFN